MSEETLSPCPFCGGEANISPYTKIGVCGAAGFYAECDNCSSGGEPFDIQGNMPDAEHSARERAITAWNTRTTTDLQSRLDAAEAKNAELVEALEWYADPVLPYAITQASEPRSAVHEDKGARARAAITQGEERDRIADMIGGL